MNHEAVKSVLCDVGRQICERCHTALRTQSIEQRSAVFKQAADDTIYQIDRDVEDLLVPALAAVAPSLGGIVLVAEGVGEDGEPVVLPHGSKADAAALRIIVDPIDGTRGLMYDKRSAFFLAGCAPNRGEATRLSDIEVAAMVELPTSRSTLSDTLYSIRGQGAFRYTRDLATGLVENRPLMPSRSPTILGGFAQIARFFPPGRDQLAALEERLVAELFPNPPAGKAILFEDQYISSGGQLYELLVGHDRFTAELRSGLYRKLNREGKQVGHVCHPYDVCAHMIGREAGLKITAPGGGALDAPFDTTSPVDWIGYANAQIEAEVAPVLNRLLREFGML
ncbi:MAG TPA: inositol monophosphatase family protein [Planctomycetota bacterium]|nr:inositol monophosphatase family protein [Planctomycetota bacterium]